MTDAAIAFVCVQNAGRSQMAYAFAQREVERRGLESDIDLVMGGTKPADRVHPEVIEAMDAVGFDLSGRSPRAVSPEDLQDCGIVITMGCSAEDVCPATWGGESRDWGLPDPHGKSMEHVAEIRDTIEHRVEALFDELSATVE